MPSFVKTVLFLLLGLMPMITPIVAHDYKAGALHIDHPWARPTPGGVNNGAAYFSIRNGGGKPDVLIAAKAAISEKAELHRHIDDHGIMRMRAVEDGIAIAPEATVTLQPGGLHVMLFGLKRPLAEGDEFPLSLTFRDAGEVTVLVKVEKTPAGAGHGGHHH